MNIYTKNGDRGTTDLIRSHNVSKSDDRINLVGTIDELTSNIEEEYRDLLSDYMEHPDRRTVLAMEKKLNELSEDDLMDKIYLAKCIGFGSGNEVLERMLHPRGYRILDYVPRLPQQIIVKIVDYFGGDLQNICAASVEDLDNVEGVGRVRSNMISRSLHRQKESVAAGSLEGRR